MSSMEFDALSKVFTLYQGFDIAWRSWTARHSSVSPGFDLI